MYSKDSFVDMMPETVPEIRRCNLSNVVLYLKVPHTSMQAARLALIDTLMSKTRCRGVMLPYSSGLICLHMFLTCVVQVLGIDDVIGFDYFEAPSQEQLQEALLLLHSLGALDDDGKVGRTASPPHPIKQGRPALPD